MLQPQPEKKVDTDEILNLEQLERHAIERAMKRSEGNLSRAAEYLGITRYALYRKLEKLGLLIDFKHSVLCCSCCYWRQHLLLPICFSGMNSISVYYFHC